MNDERAFEMIREAKAGLEKLIPTCNDLAMLKQIRDAAEKCELAITRYLLKAEMGAIEADPRLLDRYRSNRWKARG